MNDTDLLQRFVQERSETAFRTLVERHLPLVMGAAQRITGNTSLSEDVAQAVFVLLAKKASGLGPKTVLSGWLYRTACFVAKRALLSDQRRQKRELEALTMQSQADLNPAWELIAPKLDKAMASLSDTDRNALLLRFFEQQSYRDVGLALGLSEEAAKKRGSRALEKLRSLLRRHGTEVATGMLAAGLSQQAAQAAVASEFTSKVFLVSMAQTTAGSAATGGSILVKDVLAAWRLAKIKMALLSTTAAMLTLLAVLQIPSLSIPGGSQPPATNAVEIPQADRPVSSRRSAAPASDKSPQLLHLTVLDGQTEQPLQAANITYDTMPWNPDRPTEPLHTDFSGSVDIPIPALDDDDLRRMDFGVHVSAAGYASRSLNWICTTGYVSATISTQHTVRLERGITLSGTVVNEAGQTQKKVKVSVNGTDYRGFTTSHDKDGRITSPPEIRASECDSFSGECLTDSAGRFVLPHFPRELRGLILTLTGADEASSKFRTSQGKHLRVENLPLVSIEDLKRGTARLVLIGGVTVEGIVVSARGEPMPGATVSVSADSGGTKLPGKTETDSSGHFRLANCPRRELVFTASKAGWATTTLTEYIRPGVPQLRLQLSPEQPLRGLVFSPEGQSVSGAHVQAGRDIFDNTRLWSGQTDADGRFAYRAAPTNELLLSIIAPGFAPRQIHMQPSTKESVIILSRGNNETVHVTGNVVDANSGAPIDRFTTKISHEMNSTSVPMSPSRTIEGSFGTLDFIILKSEVPLRRSAQWILQIEADGYEPTCTRVYQFEEGDQKFKFQLRPGMIEGTVRTPAGQIADQALLGLATAEYPVYFRQGLLGKRDLRGQTDSNGSFKLPKQLASVALVVAHESGWATAPLTSGTNKMEITLQPWGRIEGVVSPGMRPLSKESVSLKKLAWDWSDLISVLENTRVDNDGRFVFEYVPAGEFQVSLDAQAWENKHMEIVYEQQTSVWLDAGETQTVTLGGNGRTVAARLRLGANDADVDWSHALAVLSKNVEIAPKPNRWDFLNNQSHAKAHRRYMQDPAVLAALREQRDHVGRVENDGTVRFHHVPPGRYILSVKLMDLAEAERANGKPPILARLQATVSIPEAPEGDQTPVQIGEFPLDSM